MIDGDGHQILDGNGNLINERRPIIVGDDVWVAEGVTILKGSTIPNNSVIAAKSLITKSFQKEGCLIGGQPAKIIKQNITWKR